MPYTVDNPPEAVKGLPKHAIEIFVAAFNSAFKQYEGNEQKSAATAWTAVKAKYKKNADGKWVAKETTKPAKEAKMTTDIIDDTSLVESLREQYQNLVQEVGKRNAGLDSTRIRKIVAICQELLSSEDEPDEKALKKAVKEATEALAWLQEQEYTQVEEGEEYPAAAYAYVPNIHKPGTWKLRMWEDLEKKVTKGQLGKIAAALSPGGLSGQKADIPKGELSAVKRKIRAAYRTINIQDADIPKWVKESETRELLLNYTPLTEATFDKGKAHVVIIKAGFNADKSRYYPAEVLKRDYGIFEGMKMYADHPTVEEDKERPERSIKDWVATLSNVTCDEAGTVEGDAAIIEPWLMQKLASLRDKELLSEMGISINAVGSASKATIDNVETLSIERLVAGRSVDFVTEPGAGGTVTMYESDRNHDIDLVELSSLKEKRPDLVKLIEDAVRAEITKEVKKAMENEERITELEGQIKTLTEERDGLLTKAQEAETDKLKAETRANVEKALAEADLPEAAKKRLVDQYADKTSDEGLTEAIQAEAAYVAAVRESGKVTGLGGAKQETAEDAEKALTEAAKRLRPDWTDEQVATFVRGR